MKPGLTQMDLERVDQDKLAELLADGLEKRDAFEAAVGEIEELLGMGTDELGLEDGELLDWPADALVAHAQAVLSGEGQDDEEEARDGEDY